MIYGCPINDWMLVTLLYLFFARLLVLYQLTAYLVLMYMPFSDVYACGLSLQGRPSKMAMIGEQGQVSTHTMDKVTMVKVTLENYYSNLICQNGDRESRYGLFRCFQC